MRLARSGRESGGQDGDLGTSRIATLPSPLGNEAAVVSLPHKQNDMLQDGHPLRSGMILGDSSILRSSPRPQWSIPDCSVNALGLTQSREWAALGTH